VEVSVRKEGEESAAWSVEALDSSHWERGGCRVVCREGEDQKLGRKKKNVTHAIATA